MNRLKISRLFIKNFKCFTDITFEFDGNNLIVFDGPNGYGKTTAFEAIEILLTKTPRKINKVNLDKRYTYRNSPIHKNEAEPIEICGWFANEQADQLVIKRIFPAASGVNSKKNNISQIFTESKLFVNDKELPDEDGLEEHLEYNNLKSLFNVLNYVEQDENTYFLKEDPKERYRALVSLLGGNEERLLHEKTELFIKKLLEKIGQLDTTIGELKTHNLKLLDAGPDDITYESLLHDSEQQFGWDNQTINNTNLDVHNNYINEIKKVESVYHYKEELSNVLSLKKINDFLHDAMFPQTLAEQYWKVANFEALQQEDAQRTANDTRIRNNDRVIRLIDLFEIGDLLQDAHFESFVTSGLNTEIDFAVLKTKLTAISALRESLSVQNKVLSDLKIKRENLIQSFSQHKHQTDLKDGACPACGYNWETYDDLVKQLSETEQKIFASYHLENQTFEIKKKELEDVFHIPLKTFLLQENVNLNKLNSALITAEVFGKLRDDYSQLNRQFPSFLSLFPTESAAKIISTINYRVIPDLLTIVGTVMELVNQAKPKVNDSININELVTDFNRYFAGNTQSLETLTDEKFADKIRYINLQYFNAINKDLKQLEERKAKLEGLKTEIINLSGKINDKIRIYTNKIVEKISIPFYIYTGKILQNHSLGSGLVLSLDLGRESQIYVRPKHRDQEVTYTLSSGQLSATVISLMLVLNKVFDHSRLGTIFIDDPLQTLDEINSHSLVELLKYNFGQRQILLSTHEDRYSQFMQYKFSKFNLPNKSIRLKEIM